MSEKRLLCFNCSHEMALAANVKQYFPPKSVQQMEDDLCLLPLWWAEVGDAVLVRDCVEAEKLAAKWKGVCPDVVFASWAEGYESLRQRAGCDFVPAPWGWNKSMAERMRRFGVPKEHIPSDEALESLRRLASREFVCGEFQGGGRCCALPNVVTAIPSFSRTIDFDAPEGADRLIFKSPWSSSGRGVFVADVPLADAAKARLNGYISTQGGFLVDVYYDRLLDFALEYEVAVDGPVRFLGYSVFDTGEGGRYGGNVLADQRVLRDIIERAFGRSIEDVAEHAKQRLAESLGGRYAGVAGVDMLVVNDGGSVKTHPCIEVNLRMNMGVLAMKVYERLAAAGIGVEKETALTPERKCGFVAKCVDGRLVIMRES